MDLGVFILNNGFASLGLGLPPISEHSQGSGLWRHPPPPPGIQRVFIVFPWLASIFPFGQRPGPAGVSNCSCSPLSPTEPEDMEEKLLFFFQFKLKAVAINGNNCLCRNFHISLLVEAETGRKLRYKNIYWCFLLTFC